jgi:hypothetical protein
MSLYEGFKDVVKIVKKSDNVELYQKILDLQAEALQNSQQLLDKEEKISQLKNKIEELETALDSKAELIRKNNLYFEKDADGEPTGYAYCPRCWEVDNQLIHIQQDPLNRGQSICPECDNCYAFWKPL